MRVGYLCVTALFAAAAFAQNPPTQQTKSETEVKETTGNASLPVKKVVLYKNGVGYFEHSGRVHGNQELGIEFTTAQLNDVLKSLTVVDLNGGKISGVRYNSVAPLSERLKSLQIPLSEDVTSAAFLIALRGTRVEVRNGTASALGKVFSVETVKKETTKGGTVDVTQLAIVTDTGELRVFELGPGVTVRAADGEIREDVSRYLNLMGSTRSKDVRRMTISATGSGDRNLFVSYISEVPVWKSTYRIVLPKAPGTPFLQGWAIIDNTVGEDWKDVQLSMVSGAPQSFIQNISQPYYTRRPVVPMPQSMMLTPQAHEASMEEGIGSGAGGGVGSGSGAGIGPGSGGGTGGGTFRTGVAGGVPGGVAGGSMGGVIGGVVGGIATGDRTVNTDSAEVESEEGEATAALENETAAAVGSNTGDLFEYNLKEKITVMKNQSALVPIVQSPIEAEKVTLVTAQENGEMVDRPLRALWLRNTSGLTLDGGTFNILDQDSFAGEGIMEILHPGERRLLSYAADTALRVTSREGDESKTAKRVIIMKGVMTVTREERSERVYTLHNADTTPRQVILEHPIRDHWKLTGDLKPEDTGATYYRFRVSVEPGKTEKLDVKESRPVFTSIHIGGMTDDQLKLLVEEKTIKPELEARLREIIGKRQQIFDAEQEMRTRQLEMDAIDKDQARLRENMKALKGSPEEKALLQRYTKQLDGQEDRLAELKKENADLQGKRVKLQVELEGMVQAISANETL
jgi:hypothetical protein